MHDELNIKKIAVIGAGTMGNGIAQASAVSGFDTILIDVEFSLLEKALSIIKSNMNRQIKKGNFTNEDKDLSLSRIKLSTEFSLVSSCDLVIEAATEKEEVKLKIFNKLDEMCHENAILASNTSSISINKIALSTKRANKVLGMHFMNPVPIMKLVEIIRGIDTDEDTISTIIGVSKKMNKIPIQCNDAPGFISNRILMPMINEAIYCLDEQVAKVDAIDEIMKLGMGHPMGPLTLADLIGLDICLDIMNVLHADFCDEKYKPCPLLVTMVGKGNLGRKSGKGFYNYQ